VAAIFHAAWRWVRADYDEKRHLFSIFEFGRGNYMYITREREWQQTATSLGKIASASPGFFAALHAEKLAAIPSRPRLPDVARFEWFRKGDRPAGVWAVRQGALHFALPITSGTFAGVADYLPAPHGLPGFGAPVEQPYPALVPFIERADGTVIVAGDGADRVEPAADGRSITAVWKRWVVPSTEPKATKDYMKTLALIEPGLESTVRFRIDGGRLVREETFAAASPQRLKRLWMAIPARYPRYRVESRGKEAVHVFAGPAGELAITVPQCDWPLATSVRAVEADPIGRGDRGGLPLHLVLEGRDLDVSPGRPLRWTIVLEPRAGSAAH
jgi:hypothetical protein